MTLRDSVTGSVILDGWERGRAALSSSVVAGLLLDAHRTGRRALSSSSTGQRVRQLVGRTGAAARESKTADAVRWTGRAVRGSWLYRWLTTEPEADVIVIDLRETAFVGPVLVVLDRILGPCGRHWHDSATGRAATRLSKRFAAHPVRTASAALLVAALATLALLAGRGALTRSAVGIALLVATLALAGTRVTASVDELAETRAFELAVALLAPPDPPVADGRDSSPSESDDSVDRGRE